MPKRNILARKTSDIMRRCVCGRWRPGPFQVISLQNKGPHTQPNRAIINKLREEMHKIVKCPLARPSLMYSRPPESGPFPPLPL